VVVVGTESGSKWVVVGRVVAVQEEPVGNKDWLVVGSWDWLDIGNSFSFW
jgi:hypothetical protein